MGGFRVCIYMGFSPHCIFVTSKIIYCINSHLTIVSFIHLDQLTASVHAPHFLA